MTQLLTAILSMLALTAVLALLIGMLHQNAHKIANALGWSDFRHFYLQVTDATLVSVRPTHDRGRAHSSRHRTPCFDLCVAPPG